MRAFVTQGNIMILCNIIAHKSFAYIVDGVIQLSTLDLRQYVIRLPLTQTE